MSKIFSGIQPSGDLHLGNYLGALCQWKEGQTENDATYCIVDLHALTLSVNSGDNPEELRKNTLEIARVLLAVGIDPGQCTLFAQSHVAEHSQLAWMLECTVSFGELSRMVQFKDKSSQSGSGFISAGLFTYPALQAADILLYDTEEVPVGEDQRQHIELTRDIAERFNSRFGETFVVPECATPKAGARVMDLANPQNKMSKSLDSPKGTILILDDPKDIEKKIKRAETDSENEVRYDIENKPGVSNLLEILGAALGQDPQKLDGKYSSYGDLKSAAAEAVVEMLAPIREAYGQITDSDVMTVLNAGANQARQTASATLERAQKAAGLLKLS